MSDPINDQIAEWRSEAVAVSRLAKRERFVAALSSARAAGLEREAEHLLECADALLAIRNSNTAEHRGN